MYEIIVNGDKRILRASHEVEARRIHEGVGEWCNEVKEGRRKARPLSSLVAEVLLYAAAVDPREPEQLSARSGIRKMI